MQREAREEAGIRVETEELQHVFTLHRMSSDAEYIDLFFECTQWSGEITNTEPEKCGGLEWFAINELPDNVLEYVQAVLEKYPQGVTYASIESM